MKLEASMNLWMKRHDALKTVFHKKNG